MPAVGSSSRSTSGSGARIMPSSSLRWSPCGSVRAGVWARTFKPTFSMTSHVRSSYCLKCEAVCQNLKLSRPSACEARRIFSKTVRLGKMFVIWNERPIPKWMVRWTGWWVMSRPLKMTCPLVGSRLPLSKLKKVVLPAPFGPMMACNEFLRTLRLTSSTATSAPNCLRRLFVSIMISLSIRPSSFG